MNTLNMYYWMTGFCASSVITRLDSGNTDDILFPLILLILTIFVIVIKSVGYIK